MMPLIVDLSGRVYDRLRTFGDAPLFELPLNCSHYCVLWSAQYAVKFGLRVKLPWELTRPVTEANDGMVREQFAKAKIAVI